MYLIEVIPLIRLPANAPQIMSYYFDSNLKTGSVLEVLLNHRKVSAIVISSSPLIDSKMLLKKSDYQILKAGKLLFEQPQVSQNQLRIASWISKNYYSSLGLTLAAVLPPFFGKKKYATKSEAPSPPDSNAKTTELIPKVVLASAKSMLHALSPSIQKCLHENKQILILVPDSNVGAYYYEKLAIKYADTIQITGKHINKDYFKCWNDVVSGKTKIIIGTRVSLFLPYSSLGLIIIEDSSNEMYKSDMSPKYRATDLAIEIARLNGAAVILADRVIDMANFEKITEKKATIEHSDLPLISSLKLIDMKMEHAKDNFSPISAEFKAEMIKTVTSGGKILIYAPRRGYASLYVCNNCGQSVKCQNCDISMRVHRNSSYLLRCHHCGDTKEIPRFCINCNSGNMRPAGTIGSQRIFDDLMRYIEFGQMKKVPILIFDSDVIKNELEAAEVINEVSGTAPIILIATTMILSYRYNLSFELVGITSIDALNSFTDFRTEEKLLITLGKILDFNPRLCLLQTSKIDSRINSVILSGNTGEFYNKELEDRKLFFYPPFSRIVKMTFKSPDKKKALTALRVLSEKLRMAIHQHKLENEIILRGNLSEYVFKDNNLFVAVLIMKTTPDSLNTRGILRYVPNDWNIDIDPNITA